jgi:hypothetical protein
MPKTYLDDDDFEDDDDNCPGYGAGWRQDSRDCRKCNIEYDCRDITRQNRRSRRETSTSLAKVGQQLAPTPIDYDPEVPIWAALVVRAAQNLISGVLARAGLEISIVFEEARIGPPWFRAWANKFKKQRKEDD